MCKNTLSEEKFQELKQFINNLPDKKGALIEVLHKAQNIFGYLPKEVQLHSFQDLKNLHEKLKHILKLRTLSREVEVKEKF